MADDAVSLWSISFADDARMEERLASAAVHELDQIVFIWVGHQVLMKLVLDHSL